MTTQEEHDRDGTLSVQDMKAWLDQQIRDSAKAHELRVKEATEFVTAYAEGKLTTEQASERLVQFDHRWRDALYGASALPGVADEDIVKAIDRARVERASQLRTPRRTELLR